MVQHGVKFGQIAATQVRVVLSHVLQRILHCRDVARGQKAAEPRSCASTTGLPYTMVEFVRIIAENAESHLEQRRVPIGTVPVRNNGVQLIGFVWR